MSVSRSLSKAFKSIVKKCQLRPMKSMIFAFDPFSPNVTSIRDAVYMLNLERVLDTNTDCVSKVDVKNDRSQPTITVDFNDGDRYIFKTSFLTTKDLLLKITFLCNEKDIKKELPKVPKTTKKSKPKGKKM